MAATSRAGVTSKAGLATAVVAADPGRPNSDSPRTSSAARSSMGMSRPLGVERSTVVVGAATITGMPCSRASTARPYVPILLATSPLAAILSAPTTTWETAPAAIIAPAIESVIRVWAMPSRASSQAVSREPCSRGRVSGTITRTEGSAACAARITPSAVP